MVFAKQIIPGSHQPSLHWTLVPRSQDVALWYNWPFPQGTGLAEGLPAQANSFAMSWAEFWAAPNPRYPSRSLPGTGPFSHWLPEMEMEFSQEILVYMKFRGKAGRHTVAISNPSI